MTRSYKFKVHGNTYDVKVLRRNEAGARLSVNGSEYNVDFIPDEALPSKTPTLARTVAIPDTEPSVARTASPGVAMGSGAVKAPLPGSIFKMLVREGDRVKAGQTVLIMEAMKMENEIRCASGGLVKEVCVKEGDSVLEGVLLLQIQAG
jgi:glutaconyl-CoA/methylmalonyl-CoA decarboxylase subunit gamma